MRVGAYSMGGDRCFFAVWAPLAREVAVKTGKSIFPMSRDDMGYWKAECEGCPIGTAYMYCLNGTVERPDPASRYQPDDVHGPSQVIDSRFDWGDERWAGPDPREMIMYEIHIGTFTPEGTFRAVIGRLGEIAALGVNAIEIMPVAQFPGKRSWGYEGTYPFAVQKSYGGPDGLKELVDACHGQGISVILDVVYNHLGPEGNYLADFAPYFTDRYRTPWGLAVNFDGPYSNGVRDFFIQNALYWFEDFHVDALRLDAIHGIFDHSAVPFLQELSVRVNRSSEKRRRKSYLIGESDLNDVRVVTPTDRGGFGLDAQWSDDFHHAVHALLTGEKGGYYSDFGRIEDVVTALLDGYVYQGEYSAYRKRNHGNSARGVEPRRLIFFCQNHDQVGNRMKGQRLSTLVPFEALKLAAGLLLTSPYLPLLFMGEEYGEEHPFLYFVDHLDPELIKAVREGRKEEFKEFAWQEEPPAPDSPDTFHASVLRWEKRHSGRGQMLTSCYRRLIELRREIGERTDPGKDHMRAYCSPTDNLLVMHRWSREAGVFMLCNFEGEEKDVTVPLPEGTWTKAFDAAEAAWGGEGGPLPDRIEPGGQGLSVGKYGFAVFFTRT